MTTATVVWIVVGDLGRSGVPIAVERMVRWASRHGPGAVEFHVIGGRAGPLAGALRASAASVTALEPEGARSPLDAVAAAGAAVGRETLGAWPRDRWHQHRLRSLPDPDVVLAQGAGAWALVGRLAARWSRARLVVHLHELEVALSRSGRAATDPALFTTPDAVLAVSRPVADLAVRAGAPPGRVTVVPGAVDRPPSGWGEPAPVVRPHVVSIGEVGWRKGTDRAVAAAWELRRRGEVTWHWVGAEPASAWASEVGAADPLRHHGEHDRPWSVVDRPAGLVVTSREDPMPLVALEAGARAIPVVATRTGGLVDLLADGRGRTVPGADVMALVEAVSELVESPGAAAARAAALRDHVRSQWSTEVVGPRWLAAVLGTG